jgi:15,16-dihydrobiliverdin:ferredoxin oxidoreductase
VGGQTASHKKPNNNNNNPKRKRKHPRENISRMKPQHILATASIICGGCSPVSAFSATAAGRRDTAIQMGQQREVVNAKALAELDDIILAIQSQDQLISYAQSSPGRSRMSSMSLEEATVQHGMPWSTTIGKSQEKDPLLYMPFWEWQMSFMNSTLSNLHPIECSTLNDVDVSYNENTEKKARIVNHCYASDEYRKIRMTYYDAGDSVQVFNSVWYPDVKYNLPVLGIDLLSFNRKKYLAIVDFQPLHEEEEDHSTLYEHILKPIKNKYDNLKGRMSSKFYDETQFFSKEMLFARFEDGKIVYDDLFPAFKSYVETHVKLVKNSKPASSLKTVEHVFERQQAYDTYSAERDPAAGLFAAMFGKEWAEDFIYDFLFSLSERKEEGLNLSPPIFGGPPPAAGGASHGGPPPAVGALRTQTKSKSTISMKLQ